jgi:hypothetical protein
MCQDKASQFVGIGMIDAATASGHPDKVLCVYTCLRCGALVLGDSREQHLAWHLLLRNDFLEVAEWLNPGNI